MLKKLTSSEREFLTAAVGVINANPFSRERGAIDRKLVDFPDNENYTERYQRIIAAVSQGIDRLLAVGKNNIHDFSGDDRRLIESVLVFHAYHHCFLQFDPLIEKQIAQTDKPVKVPFANDTIQMLIGFGFTDKEAKRYFSAFFQLRRAYYFIGQTIVGRSPCMRDLRESLWNNIVTADIGLYMRELIGRMDDYSTLLLGETGCGKGICASSIGRSSYIPYDESSGGFRESFTHAFVPLNLSQFSEHLIESELFGHRKGAFTGAVADYKGALARCSRYGAVFLDEIGEVSIPVQIKLLQVLEDREFLPVGSYEKKRFPGRIIAATNQELDKLRSEKLFRDDFYYRLCSDVIHVPPLRQRFREDQQELDDLVLHVVKRIVGPDSDEVGYRVLEGIREQVPEDYGWPGNVRELEQCIRRILLKNRYEVEDSKLHSKNSEEKIIADVRCADVTALELLSDYCRLLYEKYGSYGAVARITELDRRTVKKYIVR